MKTVRTVLAPASVHCAAPSISQISMPAQRSSDGVSELSQHTSRLLSEASPNEELHRVSSVFTDPNRVDSTSERLLAPTKGTIPSLPTYQNGGLSDDECVAPEETINSGGSKVIISEHHAGYLSLEAKNKETWLPFTLRLPFLGVAITASVALGAASFAVTMYSFSHSGLGTDSDSAALLFGWRFTPTLLAVLYALCTTTLLTDTRRTEVYARLAKPGGASALTTLCAPSRQWWNDPFDALSTRNSGSRSWGLLFASLANIAAFLVISPLSAGLLAPVNVKIMRQAPFTFIDMPSPVEYPKGTNDTMILQTIAGAVLNKSTSTSILEDYYVSPFSPSQSGAGAAGTQQTWTAVATAYSVQLDCSPMSVKSARNLTGPQLFNEGICEDSKGCSNETMQYGNYANIELVSEDGCSVSIYRPLIAPGLASTSVNLLTLGGGWWTNNFSNLSWTASTSTMLSYSNASSGYGSRSFLSFNTPWTADEPLKMNSHVCSSTYLAAEVIAEVIASETSTKLSIDPGEFKSSQQQLDPSALNTRSLEDTFFRANWEAHFPTGYFAGPSQALASMYGNSSRRMVESGSILESARKLQQQWLGQMLLSAQSVAGMPVTEKLASVTITERRIAAVEGIGIVIGVLFLLNAGMLAALTLQTRLQRRPLCLSDEPASVAAAAALIASDESMPEAFQGLGRASADSIHRRLRLVWCNLEDGSLSAALPDPLLQDSSAPGSVQSSGKESPPENKRKSSAPSILKIWLGILLLTTLVAVIAVLAILYRLSKTVTLHQQALVYEAHLSVASVATSLAPYSIVPTLLAVGIKLWYGAVEGTLKRLQPFSAMLDRPRPLKDSILVEHANSPLIFGSFKALRHSDWILAFACLGALGTEIFTVGISALWDKETQTTVHTVEMSRQLELRQVPTIIGTKSYGSMTHTYADPTLPTLLDTVYGDYLTSWLYGALLETMGTAETPPWSKDMWSFAPVDFSASSAAILGLSNDEPAGSLSSLPYNVSIETQAIRARLNCSPVDAAQNTSTWLETLDFKNDKAWNSTNSPPGLDIGYELREAVFVPNATLPYYMIPQRGPLQCCANETAGLAGEAAIGYGTTMGYLESKNTELFIKWIVGRPLDKLYFDANLTSTDTRYAHWVWTEEPQMQGITCNPIVEAANATVTFDLSSGVVRNYSIVGEPQNATAAWTDNDVVREPYTPVPANETQYGSEYNTTYR